MIQYKVFHLPFDANTTALLIRATHDNFLTKSPLFGGKYLITMVIFGSNLNAMAPKISGSKLEWRHSICVNTVFQNSTAAALYCARTPCT